MTEKEYRQLEIDSYSSLSAFIKDRKKYAKKFVYKEKVDDEETHYLTIGSVVDCLSLMPHEFNDKFIVGNCKPPTGQMLQFVEEVFKLSVIDVNGWKEVIELTPEILKQAYDNVNFKRDTFDKICLRFETEGKDYYKELIELRRHGKTVISIDDLNNAKRVDEGLRKSPVTGILMNTVTDNRVTVLNQLPIIFKYNGHQLKSLLDKVLIDHERKIIYLYDLKTTYNVEEFENNYYKFNYYIQAALYWIALNEWADKKGYIKDGYTVDYMQFIVCDSFNYMAPLIYTTGPEHFVQALSGFWYKGKYYVGLNEVISGIQWHRGNNIWNMSHDNFKNNGKIDIQLGDDD